MVLLKMNPIRRGDRAFAGVYHGVIEDVKGDRVLFRVAPLVQIGVPRPMHEREWRHWTSCLYGAEVISRIVLTPEHEGVDELGYCMVCWQKREEITSSECPGPNK
jgi:hypothetical protein